MSLVKVGHPLIEPLCYLSMVALSIASTVSDQVPLHLNITVFSLAIIIIGSYRSLNEMIQEMKKVLVDGKKSESIETMTSSDAMKFPLFAGGMLVGLYTLIKFFGKDSVNYVILVYIAIGGTTGIKAMLNSFLGDTFASLDEGRLIDIKNSWIELQITPYDVICCLLSFIQVGIYVYTKSWVYNNILAIVFCVHALQLMFLGNFKTGALLLSLLFFYDIFFVFGTDVMLTVAKNIDAPIKLQWPRDLTVLPPKYSILGLGDIVIPGVFVSLCLRYDFLKQLNLEKLNGLVEKETKGDGEKNGTVKYLCKVANESPKHYFYAVIFGYLVAIITTIVIMIIFDHGQPALLYLVPGCLISVGVLAAVKGEFWETWEFSENKFIEVKSDK